MKAFKFLTVAATSMAISAAVYANDFSFTGNLANDDDVQLFTFTVGATSNVTLRTWSYAGGTNAAGQVIARGGFDTILALFDSTGALINQNDDGGFANVAADALTGMPWDTFLTALLDPGTYTVSVAQYDNFAIGPNLSNGFQGSGAVGFVDVSGVVPGNQRDSHWAFDILNVNSATTIPDTGSSALLVAGAMGLLLFVNRRRA
ncbi:MAG TPA: DVUA0089 family protein [Lacunisphaera sp.]|nr:DVUA0089 family protein [Lacunisphaera sp.]